MKKILQIYIYINLFYYLKIIIEQIIESDAISISSIFVRVYNSVGDEWKPIDDMCRMFFDRCRSK